MKDLDYFIAQASNSTQREFELDFADIIEVYDEHETELTTERGSTLTIHWYSNGHYQSYQVIYETAQMEYHQKAVEDVIAKLRKMEVDGETMQYILKKVGMEDQMLKQLIGTAEEENLNYYLNLRTIEKNK